MRYLVITPAGNKTSYEFDRVSDAKNCIALKNTWYSLVLKRDWVMNQIAKTHPSLAQEKELKILYTF